jgi:hypothetical protein
MKDALDDLIDAARAFTDASAHGLYARPFNEAQVVARDWLARAVAAYTMDHLPGDAFHIRVDVPRALVRSLIASAIDSGGSRSWAVVVAYTKPDPGDPDDLGALVVKADEYVEGKSEGEHRLTPDCVRRGLEAMAQTYPWHFADAMRGHGDMVTGDVFLQLALFGELLYG